MYKQGKYQIISKKAIAKGIYDMEIYCPEIAVQTECGQFVHISAEGFLLRRPISVCAVDKVRGTLRIVFEVRGNGTDKISQLNKGELIDMIAPLGNGFKVFPGKKAVCVGGGIGTPPMLAVAAEYGADATVICGFRSASAVILQDDLKAQGNRTILCTDDGTAGRKGFVTDALKELLEAEKPDVIYACGPDVMLRAVASMAKENGISCQVSLEERMGCGVGACLVCACKAVKDGEEYFAHVCKDGPVFPAEEVMF